MCLEMYLKTKTKCTGRYTSRLYWINCRVVCGCRNGTSLQIHMEAVIRESWRCTWRPELIEIGAVLEGSQSAGGRSVLWPDRS